jgi:hypothetical protein
VGQPDYLTKSAPNLDVFSVHHLFDGRDGRYVVIDVDISGFCKMAVRADEVSPII